MYSNVYRENEGTGKLSHLILCFLLGHEVFLPEQIWHLSRTHSHLWGSALPVALLSISCSLWPCSLQQLIRQRMGTWPICTITQNVWLVWSGVNWNIVSGFLSRELDLWGTWEILVGKAEGLEGYAWQLFEDVEQIPIREPRRLGKWPSRLKTLAI